MIVIIDYGLGNLKAFLNVYKHLNIPTRIGQKSEDLKGATKIILPGVGSFDYAMKRLEKSGIRPMLDDLVIKNKIPVLGICVGMQMLAHSSEEGILPGLGWINGEVKKLNTESLTGHTYLPHMGWNTLKPVNHSNLLNNIDDHSRFYFLHSYYFFCKQRENVIAETQYGETFSCIVNSGNIFGVQFHPEKSHCWGIQILKNFAEL